MALVELEQNAVLELHLQKGMDYVQTHTPAEIAKVIAPQFAETDLATIETIVGRYAAQDTWKSDLVFSEDSFTLLENILEEAGELDLSLIHI